MLGGINQKLMWSEYVASFEDEVVQKQLELVKAYIIDHELEGMCGMEYQNSPHDAAIGEIFPSNFSFRAWGDLMAALMNTMEGARKYTYVDFAWR
jgi:hypothetical protein